MSQPTERVERTTTFVVDAGQTAERIDRWLVMRIQRATRTKVQEGIDAGAVLVNGAPTKSNYRVRPGDVITVTLMKPPPIELVPQDIPLTIVFEDDQFLIVDKPAGMVTHPGFGNRDGTLVNAVLHHVGGQLPAAIEAARLEAEDEGLAEAAEDQIGDEADVERDVELSAESDAELDDTLDAGLDVASEGASGDAPIDEREFAGALFDDSSVDDPVIEEDVTGTAEDYSRVRPGIVHRLDKDTSGLMVVAKNAEAQVFLARQFAERTATREYWAVVWGVMSEDTGEIEGNIARDRRDRKRFVVSQREGKWALTRWRVLERFEFATLVALRLATGRTHQIRVHCAHIRHPIFGDPTYGGRSVVYEGSGARHRQRVANLLAIMERQALHARLLGVWHPVTNELMEFTSEPPEDMLRLIAALRGA
jgi:23S rRNA-/tRNA-specific pseudouridylate synthase